ncbi:UDP-N-acetylmuramoyl-L-alanyl-D-glutamate--2,6-diaminopimelate ligase [Neptunomonas qingdaonensis]|uniref:UDP-N-acetylmuramoyl-L-alanyl-D-glutamate--2,6-diaminopimelate ligase n=1 Tax=Neptunomonas qingdaonensis TaxID=1045558 RepID=A0A1I2TN48_9GAMM|nr:UDP-N-acetylmuramoyl-L-alanyl-D-glutamate--2,6-diaminopimelate ligase [Neptunomonas qingdaonensis]SFG63741.1 UDP-N-acetylmuramoylalanyl-D-glutamate--2,6-diaminopimelate ligase [Neptunomonas qingdaonensis]
MITSFPESQPASLPIPISVQQLLGVEAGRELTDVVADDVIVTGISSDSRLVQAGDLFIARDGISHRGIDFIQQAATAGALAAVVERQTTQVDELASFSIPVYQVDDLANKAGVYASLMWGSPSKKMTIIGVTGTNGKTSCAHYIAQALAALGQKTALLGTVGNGFPGALNTATHTTPDAISLQRMLADFYTQGAKAVVMEVSSHALDQGRVVGVEFDVVALTNLSRDHLDYHGSMDAYAAAKSQLFIPLKRESAHAKSSGAVDADCAFVSDVHRRIVLNADDEFGRTLAEQLLANGQSFCSYSAQVSGSQQADIVVKSALLSPKGVALALRLPGADIHFDAPVVGDFNVSNLLLVVSVLHQLNTPSAQIEVAMAQVSAVPGRMECLNRPGCPAVVIDYAHTPDALEKALLAARKHCQNQLWVVFGCGGDRDTGKRAEMAAIAEQLADKIVVTSDNPRTEDPDAIINMIMQGFAAADQVVVLPEREAAISRAIQIAGPDDLILIAGKGHEDYQDIMGVKYPFSDKEIADKWMGSKSA